MNAPHCAMGAHVYRFELKKVFKETAWYSAILNESEILLHRGLFSLTIYVILFSFMVSVVKSIPWLVPFQERIEVIWYLLCHVQETSEWKPQEKVSHSAELELSEDSNPPLPFKSS